MHAIALTAPMGIRNRESVPAAPRRFGDAGRRLRWVREAAGFDTAFAFAKKLGVANSTYCRYESGETFPKPETMDKLRGIYGVDYAWISRGDLDSVPRGLSRKIEAIMAEEGRELDDDGEKRHA